MKVYINDFLGWLDFLIAHNLTNSHVRHYPVKDWREQFEQVGDDVVFSKTGEKVDFLEARK